jgi:hypothetical protein
MFCDVMRSCSFNESDDLSFRVEVGWVGTVRIDVGGFVQVLTDPSGNLQSRAPSAGYTTPQVTEEVS